MKIGYLIFLVLIISSCSNKGKKLASFTLQTLDNQTIQSETLQGKIVVINVWATWCGTCIQEIDSLNKLVAKYSHDKDVVFLALSDEDAEKIKATLRRFPFHYVQIANAEAFTSKIQTRLVKTYPQHLVLDKNLKVVFDITDGKGDIYAQLGEVITQLKKEQD